MSHLISAGLIRSGDVLMAEFDGTVTATVNDNGDIEETGGQRRSRRCRTASDRQHRPARLGLLEGTDW
jgi:hypothetical protein